MTILDQGPSADQTIAELMERKLHINDVSKERRLMINEGYEISQFIGLTSMQKERLREELTEVSINQIIMQLMSQVTTFEQQPDLRRDFNRFDFIREQLIKKAQSMPDQTDKILSSRPFTVSG